MTEVIKVNPAAPSDDPVLVRAGQVLRQGGLVAFPTETVYGLGANGLDAEAVGRIFIAKGRPVDNPLILHVESLAAAGELVDGLPPLAEPLASLFWPGPLTLVLRRRPVVPDIVSAGLPTVAIRIPAHPVALGLIRAAGVPVAAPSANSSGRPSPTTADHVLADLDGKIDIVLDAGPAEMGIESTVLDLTLPLPRLLRPGGVSVEALREALGENGLDLGEDDICRPVAPGMKYKHYSPAAPLTIVSGSTTSVLALIAEQMRRARQEGRRLAALVHSESVAQLSGLGLVLDMGPRGRPEIAGQRLFALLRVCDAERADGILAEGEEEEGLGRAIMNRLYKAAGGSILRIGEGTECAVE